MIVDVDINDIPEYFQKSKLYETSILNGNKIKIDYKFTKFDGIFTNIEELCNYLDTIQYWIFNKKNYPVEIYSILDTWSCIQYLFSIKIKYPELTIIDEISLINNKRPMRTYEPKIIVKNGLSYLEANELIEEASEKGYFGLIKYLLKIGYILTDLVALKASEKGHIDILQFCFDNIYSMKYIENRIGKDKYNNTVFLKVIFDDLQPKCYFNSICRYAAKNGHLECLILAHKYGCFWDIRVCEDSASRGQYECLKYAHENGCPWTINVCYYASQGHLKCLEYAHTHDCPWNSKLYEHAIISGDIDSIKYAYQNGCPWNNKICEDAALLNFIDILKYAIDNGAQKSSKVCNKAGSKGNFECLKYAYENGCEFNKDTCYEVNRSKNKDCIFYVHQNGCLCDMNDECLFYRAQKKSK
jgi:hypothetical protein